MLLNRKANQVLWREQQPGSQLVPIERQECREVKAGLLRGVGEGRILRLNLDQAAPQGAVIVDGVHDLSPQDQNITTADRPVCRVSNRRAGKETPNSHLYREAT